MQMSLVVSPEQLSATGIQLPELRQAAPSLFDDVRGNLPAKMVDWFVRYATPALPAQGQAGKTGVQRLGVQRLIDVGALIELTVKGVGTDASTRSREVRGGKLGRK